ncbi:ABC transporter ATP-binding protein [Paraburkholderia aspalathi]|uniref:Amino acid/amide ABC transporter ATP-binding protein 2, HAAT family n=1 Tax=Paraburkholderia aspalathi TaxID=1324617 RepID=A0A1I7EQX1_9BURK|nr:ABC transporter ATP-binding protein [Paraburkholderia aspalathi]SFU26312.1 amino acid/amide ABC transporter ATP-binding protein 2, HAAT family [Paraburkholderia aspalathi]
MTALLELEGVNGYYGASHVVRDVSLRVNEGEVVTLLGRNGAGKSTALKIIMGMVRCQRGRVMWRGRDVSALATHRLAREGLALIVEDRRIFSLLTVEGNLRVAMRRGSPWQLSDIYRIFPRLEERRRNGAGKLSGGEQQMLAIARALLNGPSLLLLDEPTEGLAPVIVEHLADTLAQIAAGGMTILLVEQNLAVCERLANRHYILEEGQIVYHGSSPEFRLADHVKKLYLAV